jgi:hypothetical protein
MKRQAIAAAIGLAVVGCVAVGVVIWFTLDSSGTGTASAEGTCSTVLLEDVSAGERWISVADLTDCDVGVWIVINPGTPTQEYHRVEITGSFNELKLDTGLAFGHSVGERVEEVLCAEPIWPGIHCGTYGALEPWPDAELTLNPDSGPAGSGLEVEFTNIRANDACQQHTEVLWDWSLSGGGEEIGSGYVNAGATSLTLAAAVPDDAGPGEGSVTACWWNFLDYTWYYKSAPFEVTEAEESPTPGPTQAPTATRTPTATAVSTPTPTATPEPSPKPNRICNCPQAGKWSMAAWQGDYGVDIGEAMATCGEGAVRAAYALDPWTQEWLKWFPDRPELSSLTMVEDMQGVFVLGSPTAEPPDVACEPDPAAMNEMRGCPLPGKWSMAVWNGADGTDIGEALATCGTWAVEMGYALDENRWVYMSGGPAEPPLGGAPDYTKLVALKTFLLFGKLADPLKPTIVYEFQGDIYVVNFDGPDTKLTTGPGFDGDPAWSPDGKWIAFVSESASFGEFHIRKHLWKMYPDGTHKTPIQTCLDCMYPPAEIADPAWSPDGKKIAYVSWDNPKFEKGGEENPMAGQLRVVDADGMFGPLGETVAQHIFFAHLSNPTWSSDGKWIAVEKSFLEYANCCETSFGVGCLEPSCVYKDAGLWRIALLGPTVQLMPWVFVDVPGLLWFERYLRLDPVNDFEPDWSPDGVSIVFTSDSSGIDQIYTMPWTGGSPTAVLKENSGQREPAWSPDGSKIAYVRPYKPGLPQIIVIDADGTDGEPVAWGMEPDWSPPPYLWK